MFKHLLVPLDGSHLAESVLPAATYLAQATSAAVTLIHVIERNAPPEVHRDRHLTNPAEAQAYLDEIAHRAFPPQVQVERHVHTNEVRDVARSIADHAAEFNPDLVVMCTHGQSGLRQFLFGSIAQQVIALGTTPVLLIHPAQAQGSLSFNCRQMLVPLDGDADHEQGLPVAAGLARLCGTTIHLVMVIPTPETLSGEQAAAAKLLPQAARVLLELKQEGADAYLRQHLDKWRAAGLTVTAEIVRGDPASNLVQTAQRIRADVIVCGTHGKSGLEAFWSGSVAPKVSGSTRVPLLLVPLRKPAAHS